MIQLHNFSLSYGKKRVLDSINLSIGESDKVAVIGSNASGKTSLALFLAKVIPDFIPAKTTGFAELPEKLSLIMQNPSNQFLAITVKEELGPAAVLAEKFNAVHLLGKNVFELSEGEKQKINLISNIASNPKALLLDEPLELLDPLEAKRFHEAISGIESQAIVWFDKALEFVPEFKKFFLSKQEKIVFPKKKKNPLGNRILNLDINMRRNSFGLKAALDLRQGEKIGIIGLNGSGKSSLLKAIAGIQKYSGKIELKKRISFAPQNPSHLFFHETVEQELPDAKNAVLLGVSHLLKQNPEKLSRGQQKLVSIATVQQGSLLLLDEPTTWLDSSNKALVYNFINNSTDAMLIATHDKKLLDYCDRVFCIEKGVLEECSSTATNRFFLARQN